MENQNGFYVDKEGYPTGLYNGFGEKTPSDVRIPKDFDAVYEAMTAPAEERKRPKFEKDGSYTFEEDPESVKFLEQKQRLLAVLNG